MKRHGKSGPAPKAGEAGSRLIVRIGLSERGADAFGALYRERGMPQRTVVDRLLAWVEAQPESVQAAILGMYPPADRPRRRPGDPGADGEGAGVRD